MSSAAKSVRIEQGLDWYLNTHITSLDVYALRWPRTGFRPDTWQDVIILSKCLGEESIFRQYLTAILYPGLVEIRTGFEAAISSGGLVNTCSVLYFLFSLTDLDCSQKETSAGKSMRLRTFEDEGVDSCQPASRHGESVILERLNHETIFTMPEPSWTKCIRQIM
jgi:hypothetical protein